MFSFYSTPNLNSAGANFFMPQRSLLRRGVGRLSKTALGWRYRRFVPGAQRPHYSRVGRIRLYISRGVFDPRLHFTGAFLSRYLLKSGAARSARVLDLGTGSGLLAITAALGGAHKVAAGDIDAHAVSCARANVARYALGDRVTVLGGDMFAPFANQKFDLIVCNPPYFKGIPRTQAERAYYAGDDYEWLTRFALELPQHLERDGRALLVLGSAADLPAVLNHLTTPLLQLRPVARHDIWVEVLYILEIRHKPGITT